MAQLLSGSIGKVSHLTSSCLIGSLVEFEHKNYYGIIVKKIDYDVKDKDSRYWVYYDQGTMFGTYMADLKMIQLLSGS